MLLFVWLLEQPIPPESLSRFVAYSGSVLALTAASATDGPALLTNRRAAATPPLHLQALVAAPCAGWREKA